MSGMNRTKTHPAQEEEYTPFLISRGKSTVITTQFEYMKETNDQTWHKSENAKLDPALYP